MTIKALDIAHVAAQALDDKLAEQVRIVDVRELTSLMDYCVIATGQTPPHLKAMLAEIQRQLKEVGASSYRKSGDPESGWMVLDYVDVVIHIFSPEARAYYDIETLWAEAPDLPLPASA